MSDLPRVTYSNFDIDLAPVHAQFDALLPSFERRELGQSHRSMIDGVSVNLSASPATITSPIDRNIVVGRVSPATADQVSEAVSAAAARAKSWAATPTAERIRLLRAFARELAKRRFQLALAALFEVGKSRIEAIGEAEEAVDLADYYATQMEERQGYRQALSQVRAGEITESLLLPFGVFAVVAPFNFPIALSVNMLSAALVTGNTVVFKPAPACSLSGRMIVEAALEAGIPPGALNLVLGGAQVGQALVSHPLVAGVAFTGSHDAGMQIARAALSGGYAKPVIAEMGGKNPAYVTAHADLDVAAQGVARSAFGLQGQKCSACSVAYVEEAVKDAFIAKLQAVTATFKLGDPRAVDTFMGAVQSQATVDRFHAATEAAKQQGRIIAGGHRITEGALARGYFLQPTIAEFPAPHRVTQEELFMPYVAIRSAPSLASALAEGNAVKYGLAAGIYTRDPGELQYFLDTVQAGVVYANRASGATTGAWPGIQTFCGWKGSGVTHKGGLGPHFLPLFTHEQSRTLILS